MTNKKQNDLHHSHTPLVAAFKESGAGECVGETSMCVCVFLSLSPAISVGLQCHPKQKQCRAVLGTSLCSGKLEDVSRLALSFHFVLKAGRTGSFVFLSLLICLHQLCRW